MIFVDVEGEVSAASMVKDSKIYIEIAKFVQAYEAIVSDPNKFLVDIDERPIDAEKEVLTWDQFVDIATNCDLGFTPKPDAQMLAVYYSYAMQIGSISKEVKRIATVEDIAEAQKKYYNFIDDTTAKVENQYKKQHEIASRRAREAAHVEKNISNKKLKLVGVFAAMAFGVFLCGLGLAGMFFDIGFVKFFGFGNRFIGGVILMIVGFLIFFFLDKHYLKFKRDYLTYKADSQSVISRSDRTTNDELILKDKLDKYKEDLKIAKYELADKNKTYDVSAAIEKLREKNKYFQDMFERDGIDPRLGIFGSKNAMGLDDMPLGFKPGDKIDDFLKLGKKDPAFDNENMRDPSGGGFINTGMIGPDGFPMDPRMAGGIFTGKPGEFPGRVDKHGRPIRPERGGDPRRDDYTGGADRFDKFGKKKGPNSDEFLRKQQEDTTRQTQVANDVLDTDRRNGKIASSRSSFTKTTSPQSESFDTSISSVDVATIIDEHKTSQSTATTTSQINKSSSENDSLTHNTSKTADPTKKNDSLSSKPKKELTEQELIEKLAEEALSK